MEQISGPQVRDRIPLDSWSLDMHRLYFAFTSVTLSLLSRIRTLLHFQSHLGAAGCGSHPDSGLSPAAFPVASPIPAPISPLPSTCSAPTTAAGPRAQFQYLTVLRDLAYAIPSVSKLWEPMHQEGGQAGPHPCGPGHLGSSKY